MFPIVYLQVGRKRLFLLFGQEVGLHEVEEGAGVDDDVSLEVLHADLLVGFQAEEILDLSAVLLV